MMLLKLVTHMDPERFDNIVISLTGPGRLGPAFAERGILVVTLNLTSGLGMVSGVPRLVGLLRRATILQTWLYHSDLVGLLAGSIARTPAILWNLRCSDMDMSRYRLQSRIVRRMLVRLSGIPTMILANSSSAKAVHEQLGYRPKLWRIIPNGFETDEFRPDREMRAAVRRELGVADDAILIGLPARFDPMKDHANFFAAAAILSRSAPQVRFVAFGNGIDARNPALDALLRANDLADKAFLLGERRDMPRVLNALDIVSLTSAFGEGFPNILGEAMAVGVPCVSTAVGDAPLIIGDTGRIVPPRDPDALAQAWRSMIDCGAEACQTMGLAARQRIVDNFSLRTIVREYEALFGAIADAVGRRRETGTAIP
jgi:glycosyltransferase involved in cell wall biosynthesis